MEEIIRSSFDSGTTSTTVDNKTDVDLTGLYYWPVDVPTRLGVLYTILEIFCSILATVGNSLVLYVYIRQRSLRTVKNSYVVSLAAADLAVGLIGIPAALATSVGLPTQFELCIVMNSILLILCTASIASLVAVTIDRLWAITRPLTYVITMTTYRARLTIAGCWTFATVIGMLPLIGWNAGRPPVPRCFFAEVMDGGFLVFVFIGTIISPSIFMAIVYFVIFRSIQEQGKALQSFRRNISSPGTAITRSVQERSEMESEEGRIDISRDESRGRARNVEEEGNSTTSASSRSSAAINSRTDSNRSSAANGNTTSASNRSAKGRTDKQQQEQQKQQRRQQLQTESKAAQSVAMLVIVFLISWLPLYSLNTIDWFCGATSGKYSSALTTTLPFVDVGVVSIASRGPSYFWMTNRSVSTTPGPSESWDGYCRPPIMAFNVAIILSHYNSVWNPLLYAWGMRDIRRELRKLLFRNTVEREQLLSKR